MEQNYLVILATSLPFSLEHGIRLSRGILHVEFIGIVYHMRGVIHSMRSNTEYVNASLSPSRRRVSHTRNRLRNLFH